MTKLATGAFVQLLLIGCVGNHAERRGSARQASEATLAALLKDHCADCHDGDPRRPQLARPENLTRDGALRAAVMVAAHRMPPPPGGLERPTQASLIRELCRHASVSAKQCDDVFDPTQRTAFVLAPDELLRAMSAIAPSASNGSPTAGERELVNHVPRDTLVLQLDPSLVLYTVFIAAERCAQRADAAAHRACMQSLLDPKLSTVPPPAAPADTPPPGAGAR